MEIIRRIFSLPDLRNRILISAGLLMGERILAHIPMPGIDLTTLKNFFSQNQIFGFLDMFSGGSLANFSIVLMGVGPYITATIIMQLLAVIVPSVEALQKEGEYGRQKINQYTRYLTIPLAAFQAYAMLALLKSQGVIGEIAGFSLLSMLVATTAGTMLLMWLGEIISEKGIGNGISLIITVGILSGIPAQVRNTAAVLDTGKIIGLIGFLILAVLTIALIVLVNEAQRRIPVTYARRVRGTRSWGGVDTHLPIRVNTAGVIPIIFAISMLLFPSVVARFFSTARTPWIASAATSLNNLFQNNLFHGISYFILVIVFTFFYTFIVFKPNQVSENLQKQGGFVPGIRPGRETAEFIRLVLSRITFVGAIFLGVIAVLPFIAQAITGIQTLVLGGTGLLIIVSVIIETGRQIRAQLVMRTYEQY